jgi:pimeloyl-ACP methyl ester carboxylesterase
VAAANNRRRRIGVATAVVASAVLLTSLALLAIGRMTGDDAPSNAPEGAELATIPSGEVGLAARLWTRHSERIAVLLHGFAGDQHDWDDTIGPLQAALEEPISVLTFDFRGHGDSDGENRDLEGMASDVRAAIAFARSRGFTDIVLVGASMGGAAAIVAAAEDPSIAGVIALSAPAELGDLDAVDAMASMSAPVGLMASKDDPSAAESLERLRTEAGARASLAIIYLGNAHGVDLVEGDEARDQLARAIDGLWSDEAPD